MRELVRRAKYNPANRDIAAQIVGRCPPKAFACEANAILNWIRAHVRYTLDINEIEVIQTPQVTLRLGYGDCDDMAILAATFLECIGHAARFLAMGFGAEQLYSHVIVQTKLAAEGPWIPLDATETYPFGWQPPNAKWTMGCEI